MAGTVDDLSAREFWFRPPAERERVFAVLRREQPVSWQRAPESILLPPELDSTGGYWAVVGYDDVRTVSRSPQLFCSGRGVLFEDAPPENLEASQSFLAMDAPRHTKVRGLVSSAFTPRRVARIEQRIAEHAREIVDELLEHREGDFVEVVARKLPMRTISDMIGVPADRRETVTAAAEGLVSWNDPDFVGGRTPLEAMLEGLMTLTQIALEMADDRAARPAEDLMTALVQAEVDGERLTREEIAAFFVLLSVAGNDTTRHSTSHAMRALQEHPDQRAILAADPDGLLPVAVEELVRWVTPVMNFRRTATQDTELHGVRISEGEKVVMFYSSANRDESAFEHPERLDVTRHPNHHVGFGGGGPHYCLGASLARTQLRSLLGELLTRAPGLEVGEPELLLGSFINGVKRMPFALPS
jgi:cytochrome P450